MLGWLIRIVALWLVLAMASPFVAGQTLQATNVSLDKMNFSAGTVFAGRVIKVVRVNGTEPAFVRVQFLVDEAVRGCKAGEIVTVNEWIGLWTHGDRYREGQRVVLLLYPPSEAGLSSPVAGDIGNFHVGSDGLFRVTPLQAPLLSSRPNSEQDSRTERHKPSEMRPEGQKFPRKNLRSAEASQ
jgi:hypothetical protein